ncbi:nuclear transport factor 2 family protein [Bradyrhizobium sp. AZCC 2289]|uniref:nuclear transport factor 2 family protein n=1 Tax=Bradyrhizobium sp. AZCC 2289 TaxID=3117026 RepID=UPI002FF2694D
MQPIAITNWKRFFSTGALPELEACLAEEVIFESPVVHTPQVGKAITVKYLYSGQRVFHNPSFVYVREWTASNSSVLELQTVINGISINGVDIISWNDDDKITSFKVMIRPLKAIQLVHQLMMQELLKNTSPS